MVISEIFVIFAVDILWLSIAFHLAYSLVFLCREKHTTAM